MQRFYLSLLMGTYILMTFTGNEVIHSLIHNSTSILHDAKLGGTSIEFDVLLAAYLSYFSSVSRIAEPSLVYLQLNSTLIPVNDVARMEAVRGGKWSYRCLLFLLKDRKLI